MDSKEFYDSIIAQDDDCDYQENGYFVRIIAPNIVGIAHYGHCSCYDTWEAVGESVDWEGTVDELIHIAKNKLDYTIPDRLANEDDCDYDHLMEVYSQINDIFMPEMEEITTEEELMKMRIFLQEKGWMSDDMSLNAVIGIYGLLT